MRPTIHRSSDATDRKYYLLKHDEFARATRAADPSITLPAPCPEEANIEGVVAGWRVPFDQVDVCSDADWTCGVSFLDDERPHVLATAAAKDEMAQLKHGRTGRDAEN